MGFVVSQKGIEIDPDKVKAIQNLPPPRTQKEVKGFLGRLNYIARFISQLTAKSVILSSNSLENMIQENGMRNAR